VRLLATGLVVLGGLALGIAAYLIALRGWGAVAFAAIGWLLLYAYDAAPRALKELGLGEVAAFAVWGPLMIGGGYYVIAMYAVTAVAIAVGATTPFTVVVLVAGPRALRALRVMSRPAPDVAPPGYVGWPPWYHRVCLVHNRAFGWLLLAGLAIGSIWPATRIG